MTPDPEPCAAQLVWDGDVDDCGMTQHGPTQRTEQLKKQYCDLALPVRQLLQSFAERSLGPTTWCERVQAHLQLVAGQLPAFLKRLDEKLAGAQAKLAQREAKYSAGGERVTWPLAGGPLHSLSSPCYSSVCITWIDGMLCGCCAGLQLNSSQRYQLDKLAGVVGSIKLCLGRAGSLLERIRASQLVISLQAGASGTSQPVSVQLLPRVAVSSGCLATLLEDTGATLKETVTLLRTPANVLLVGVLQTYDHCWSMPVVRLFLDKQVAHEVVPSIIDRCMLCVCLARVLAILSDPPPRACVRQDGQGCARSHGWCNGPVGPLS